jgi:hypothetical protein
MDEHGMNMVEWGICWVRFGQHSKTVLGEAKNVQGCF